MRNDYVFDLDCARIYVMMTDLKVYAFCLYVIITYIGLPCGTFIRNHYVYELYSDAVIRNHYVLHDPG